MTPEELAYKLDCTKTQLMFLSNTEDAYNSTYHFAELSSEYYEFQEEIWYTINFSFVGEDLGNGSRYIIICELYYEIIDYTRIVRDFLFKPSVSVIPIDAQHVNNYWTPIIPPETTSTTVNPPDSDGLSFLVMFIIMIFRLLLGIGIIFVITGTCILMLYFWKQRKRKRNYQSQMIPSQKALQKTDTIATAVYNPKPIIIKPETENLSYELYTTQPKQVTCAICYQTIEDDSLIIRCPACDVAFHKHHLYEWVKNKGTCPVCKARLSVQSLDKQGN